MTRAIIAGWLAAGGLVALGWHLGVAIHRRSCERTQVRLAWRLLHAEGNQDHQRCQEIVDAMAAYVAWQERQIDLLAADSSVVADEAERFLREAER